MSQTTLKLSVLATLLLLAGGISAQADETFTVRIENVSANNALKLSNGKTEPVGVPLHPPPLWQLSEAWATETT